MAFSGVMPGACQIVLVFTTDVNFVWMEASAPTPTGLRAFKKARTRLAISDVATRLFMQHGFEQVTVAQIAEAAEVSPKTVFNYFTSKEELFFDRADDVLGALVDAVVERPAGVT